MNSKMHFLNKYIGYYYYRKLPRSMRRYLERQLSDDWERETNEWLGVRKKAALKIDPKTAKVAGFYVQVLDPYGILPFLPGECSQGGCDRFVRAPGSKVWVWFGDLPVATLAALKKRNML